MNITEKEFYSQLKFIAQERGYKRGWIGFKYRLRFGNWPSKEFRDLQPMKPEVEVLIFIMKMRIGDFR